MKRNVWHNETAYVLLKSKNALYHSSPDIPFLPSRWNRPAVEPSQGSHRSGPRSTQVCEAGQAPLWARAGAVLRDPEKEHPEIQQLHLPHCVRQRQHQQGLAASASEFCSMGGIRGEDTGVKNVGFTSAMTGHSFPVFLLFVFFCFFHFAHFFLSLTSWILTWSVLSRSFMSKTTCRSVKVRAREASSTVNES